MVGPLPPPAGGMANQMRQLSELLGLEKYDVHIVRTNTPYRPRWIARYKGVRAVFRLFSYLGQLWHIPGKTQVCHVLANSGMSWHLFAAPAVWAAYLKGIPVIINYRGGEADEFFRKSFPWVRPTLNRASMITVPSGYLADVFEKWGIDTKIVPNIINLELFHPRPINNPCDLLQNPHILVARNLEPIYGVDTALYAFRSLLDEVPDARMTIAGSGPQLTALQNLARELGITQKLRFTGRMENSKMAALYQEADILLNASLVDNMPVSLLEAMASGVPIVSTSAGGIPYLVEQNKTALLVDPGDSKAMAKALARLASNGELRTSLIRNGLVKIERYSWSSVRNSLLDIYHSIVVPEK